MGRHRCRGVASLDAVRYRDTEDLAIDKLFFSTFFGGNSASHAPFDDRTIDFDDFVISEEPIEMD